MISTEGLTGHVSNDPSDLCTRCGLCCIVLQAEILEKETDHFLQIARQKGFGPRFCDEFCKKEDGRFLIDMPCPFLEGKVLQRISCLVHSLSERPSVCQGYLCKIAIKYQLGLITVEEGQKLLRASLILGDVGIFNWIKVDPSEDIVVRARDMSEIAAALREQGIDDELITLIVCSNMVPKYRINSSLSNIMLSMFLYNTDRKNIDAQMFFDTSAFSDSAKHFADQITLKVMEQILNLFHRINLP